MRDTRFVGPRTLQGPVETRDSTWPTTKTLPTQNRRAALASPEGCPYILERFAAAAGRHLPLIRDTGATPDMIGPLTTLFRPVGQAELDLIAASGFRRFPPRPPGQPIFYPVLTETYAVEIARDWNTRDEASGFAGYVLRFSVDSGFLARYPEQIAGAARHRELWVPAAELEEFNRHIHGPIEVVAEFHGRPAATPMSGSVPIPPVTP